MPQQMSFLDGQYTKMFPEHSAPIRERTSESSSKNLFGSTSRPPRCLRLIKGNGPMQTLSWGQDGHWLTELSTLNIGESPKDAEESTLSQILEENVPERYYLSAKACEGILRRASKRGKALPDMLLTALEQQMVRMA